MDSFLKLIKVRAFKILCWLFILSAFSVSFHVKADTIPADPQPNVTFNSNVGNFGPCLSLPSESAARACSEADILSMFPDNSTCIVTRDSPDALSPLNVHYTYSGTNGIGQACVAGFRITGSHGVCPSDYELSADETTCSNNVPDSCADNLAEWSGISVIYTSATFQSTACYQGCEVNLGGSSVELCTGDNRCSGTITTKTGSSCSGGTTGMPPQDPEDECLASGRVYITYGGVTSCVDVGTTGAPSATLKQTPPPITQTETPPPTPENPNPEPVTTTTQPPTITVTGGGSGAGSQPTVTEETTNADGSKSTVSMSKGQYCELNPDAELCGDGLDSYFAGSCTAGFTCEGDAVMCSIAREQHKARCDDFASVQEHQGAIDKGTALLSGTYDTDVQAFLDGTDTTTQVNLPEELSEDGVTLPASGLNDLTVAFQGQTIVLPFSKLNRFLEMLGFVILACSYVSALRIVGVF